jgi:hypothetical protein
MTNSAPFNINPGGCGMSTPVPDFGIVPDTVTIMASRPADLIQCGTVQLVQASLARGSFIP